MAERSSGGNSGGPGGGSGDGPGLGARKPSGTGGRNRNAYCSFCRRSHRDVGPLVEGPGDVYICGECIDLCQSIIEQERKRRGPGKAVGANANTPSPRSIKETFVAPTDYRYPHMG